MFNISIRFHLIISFQNDKFFDKNVKSGETKSQKRQCKSYVCLYIMRDLNKMTQSDKKKKM